MLKLITALIASPILVFASSAVPAESFPAEPVPSVLAERAESSVYEVPFYSQFADISSPTWQKVGCGITDLAMIIDFYTDNAPTVEVLLAEGIAAGAYAQNAGWTYQGLINVSKNYGLDGSFYDLAPAGQDAALARLKTDLEEGPVIASVHYEFDPASTIPHLVVVNGIVDDTVYYNDPAADGGGKEISLDRFLKAWKKRAVVIRPAEAARVALAQ